MKKLSHQTWAKVIALVLAAITGIIGIVSLCGTILIAGFDNRMTDSDIGHYVNQKIAENYAAKLLDDVFDGTQGYDAMDGGNLEYTIATAQILDDNTEVTQLEADQFKTLYSNNEEEVSSQNYDYVFSGEKADSFNYNVSSMVGAVLYQAQSRSANHDYRQESIQGFSFDYEAGKLYAQTETKYILIRNLVVEFEDGERSYYWDDQRSLYINPEDGEMLNSSEYQTWLGLYADDIYYLNTELNDSIYHVSYDTTDELDTDKKRYEGDGCYVSDRDIVYPEILDGPIENYYVFMKLKSPVGAELTMNNGIQDYFAGAEDGTRMILHFKGYGIAIQIGSLILFLCSMGFLTLGAGHRKEDEEIHLRWMDKIPFAIYATVVGFGVVYGAAGNIALVLYGSSGFSIRSLIALELEIALLWMLLFIAFYLSIVTRIKAHCFWRYTIVHYIAAPFRTSINWIKEKNANIRREMHENISLFWKVAGILVILFFVELFVIATTEYDLGLEMCLFVIYKVVEAIIVIGIVLQMNSLKEGGKRIAQGNYNDPIDTKGMYWEFKKHAENINAVGNGISLAVDERMKSEHFKTELITNVSHDIKTPLTSIINYVDLMKKENITDATILEYVDVLDRQSARLKKLIEDLMEASKASTGNLSVNLEQFDASVMLTQVVGEFEERTSANQLDLIVSHPEEPVYIMADGRHLWRVFDNLLSNVCKYAQPGTRVYINLDRKDGNVIITFRNTSKYQLNITSEELMERFVRGDSSRNTEGNGLGLSIAQSLMTLQKGTLKLDIDGDLFKVTLTFREV